MKHCKRCYRLKDDNDYRNIRRVGRILAWDGPEEVDIKHYLLNDCKECNARKKRYKKGTQTEQDVMEEILIMLEKDRRWVA